MMDRTVLGAFAAFAMCATQLLADNSRLVAHRGDASRFPQNTIEAIRSAVENGAGMIEIDIVKCKTGELVVYGERDLEYATDGTGVVINASFDYLRSLSAHAPKKFGDKFKGRCRIPTFEEALAAIPDGGPYINCDCRNDPVGVALAIKKAGKLKQAFIAIGTRGIKRVRAVVPEVMICNMSRPTTPRKKWTHEEHMRYATETVKHGCQFVQYIGVSNVPPADVVGYCHDNNVKVLYVKNDFAAARARIFGENGVDFIFTDRLPAQKSGANLFTDRLPAQKPGVNLISNGDFNEQRDGGAHGWKGVNGFVFLKTGGRDGFGCAAVTNHNVAKPSYIVKEFPIKGGRDYEISAWIKSEDVKGTKNGAMPYAEVKDADGKCLPNCGIYPKGALGTSGWKRYSGILHAPHQAVTMSLGAMLFPNTQGKAWVDDMECIQLPEKPVKGVSIDAYRNMAERGAVKIAAILGLDPGTSEKSSGHFSVADASGKVVRKFEPDSLSDVSACVSADMSALAPGRYEVSFILKDALDRVFESEKTHLEIVNRLPKRKVFIDRFHRTIVDGKPFFPIGMYSYDITDKDIELYTEAPFTCIMSYRVPTTEQMDVFAKHGLKAIIGFSNYFYGLTQKFKTLDDEIAFVKEAVNRLKGHPATLAWYLHDEIPIIFLPRLNERQKMVHDLDPDHPTWGVTDKPHIIELELDSFDIAGNGCYPIYNENKKNMTKSWLRPRLSVSQTRGTRAIWQVPQAFTWANYRKLPAEKGTCRLPTFDEMRTMAYQQLAGGSDGIIFYSFHDVNKTRRDEPEKWPGYWADVKRLATELRSYEYVWLGEPSDAVEVVAGGSCEKHSVRSWRVGGEDYVLVASGEPKPTSLSLRVKSGGTTPHAVFGPEPKVNDEAGAFVIQLDPYGIVFLKK